MEKNFTTVDLGNGNKVLVIGGVVVMVEKDETPEPVVPDPVVNQYISWDTHGSPDVRGNVRRSGYITALPDAPGGSYSIRGEQCGDMYYMKRARFIASYGYDKVTPYLRK